MITYPIIDPVAIHLPIPVIMTHIIPMDLGSISIYWYGLMYLFSFLIGWGLLRIRLYLKHCNAGSDCNSNHTPMTTGQLSDILFYFALGVIVGGRIGYIVFYAWSDFITHPIILMQLWKGGMSFHGGLLGVMIALGCYSIKNKLSFIDTMDFIAPVVPIGLAAGRIGNFINGELWGRVTHVPWSMIFPRADNLPRHPSQLYEFLFEGIILFTLLWFFSNKNRPRGAVSGLFLILYGLFRFSLEFFREPDQQMGFIMWGWLTAGQALSLPMILFGIVLFLVACRLKSHVHSTPSR